MQKQESNSVQNTGMVQDLIAGMVVFLVAVSLCLGIANASKAAPIAGLISGIIGGIVVGSISRSATSVSGPAAGLAAVVAAQITQFGFENFLVVVFLAGLIQIGLGLFKAGVMSSFVSSSVIKGLLASIGVLLILKEIPHLLGHDTDPVGEMSFQQPDHENTFSEFYRLIGDIHPGAATIGILSLVLLFVWDKIPLLKKSIVPVQLLVVVAGVLGQILLEGRGELWNIQSNHLVEVPIPKSGESWTTLLTFPNFSAFNKPGIFLAAVTIALVASLETLLNIEAVDKLDPWKRTTPASHELVAQGIGNTLCGLIGGIPVTSVIARSSVNISAGARTKASTIIHGSLLLGCVLFLPQWLNKIPLSSLAAVLISTGFKLASPKLVKRMWSEGLNQFIPFVGTIVAIVLTDLLIGTLIGIGLSISFILNSNLKRPLRRILEKHLGGEVLRIELANQVSFLNRAVLLKTLREIPNGGHVLIDARNTNYIDPDILDMLFEFRDETAPAHGIQVSFLGFLDRHKIDDNIQYIDFSNRELQSQITPEQVLDILKEGNERFRTGRRITRDAGRLVTATASGQFPLAVILSCIDSRTPAEMIFDLGLGDIFSIRIAGNVTSEKVIGSMEYGCAVAGAKLVLVCGHTRCGAISATVDAVCGNKLPEIAHQCHHLNSITGEIGKSIDNAACQLLLNESDRELQINEVARKNVQHSLRSIREQSPVLANLEKSGQIAIIGAIYDVTTGSLEIMD